MTIRRDDGSVTLTAGRRIDANTAPCFAAEIEAALDGATDLTLDFSALDYISSSGLRAVMLAVKAMNRRGGLRIINVRKPVYEVLEVIGFTSLCDIETIAE